MDTKNVATRYRVRYYPKFHCELNHVIYFWYNRKSWTRRNYKYTLEGLKKNVP